jgi:hypothetical protein
MISCLSSIVVHVEALEDMRIGAVELQYLGCGQIGRLPVFDYCNSLAVLSLHQDGP